VAQIIYTHVTKCINDKTKLKKNKNTVGGWRHGLSCITANTNTHKKKEKKKNSARAGVREYNSVVECLSSMHTTL
jgi:hypothetical protein